MPPGDLVSRPLQSGDALLVALGAHQQRPRRRRTLRSYLRRDGERRGGLGQGGRVEQFDRGGAERMICERRRSPGDAGRPGKRQQQGAAYRRAGRQTQGDGGEQAQRPP